MYRSLFVACFSFLLFAAPQLPAQETLPPIPPIKRLLPPQGIEIPAEVRTELEAKLTELEPRIAKFKPRTANLLPDRSPDVEIFTKAVAFALKFNEFYDKKDFDKARWAIAQASARLDQLEKGETPWTKQTGLIVRGYRSSVDGSVQPYGLVIPDKHDFSKPCPLYVFLHGRGDKETDLHFLYGRARSKGEIAPDNAIVLHPFGRQCLGFKSAGERDVLEASFTIDWAFKTSARPVLIGFSMGGAGAWHLGAHLPTRWSAISPGAGFVDVAKYQKLKPDNFPAIYEQKLWGVYDVPDYTRNLFNVPVIAYSGEVDPQKQAADQMASAFKNEGRELTHLIGPATAHKYHPDVKKDLLARLDNIVQAEAKEYEKLERDREAGKDSFTVAPEAHLQTRTLRYRLGGWLGAAGLKEHWQDSRLDGKYKDGKFEIATKNITRFYVLTIGSPASRSFEIDGKVVEATPEKAELEEVAAFFVLENGKWHQSPSFLKLRDTYRHFKRPDIQGPIDDGFLESFLVVTPSGKSKHPRVQQWVDYELAHFDDRWQATFRGTLWMKKDTEVTAEDMKNHHLVCFGDAMSNRIIRDSLAKLPLAWTDEKLTLADTSYDAATHMPLMIYPNPAYPQKYIVFNSGPTFREAHDRTNSLQNPKLPDWAIIDITTPPNAEKPGKVVAADFFDEQWQVKGK